MVAAINPLLGYVVLVIELVLVVAIVVTAMYGSDQISERAFRLIRLLFNRREPPTRRASIRPPR
ncbi:hypothetical protein Aple_016890 [Acrocarpospora pleiomorpha]|uniref:Uncharacterized protein n=1 Tax=Acrocarpospora pleiomorpha TaxID=90975 RepID=A0A5M3XC93_9ACTN|nr:hypothetical protein Aple_016890 [Acrocarpospora pleiomorpha]